MQNKPPEKIADIQNIHNIAQGLYILNITSSVPFLPGGISIYS
jgi:hypothetical protein